MKTLLDELGMDAPWLVRLVAGLPGGIGNSRNECGAVTAPLVLLGLRHAGDPTIAGVPPAVRHAHALIEAFRARHGSTACRDILGDARVPLRCIPVVRRAPERCVAVESNDHAGTMTGERLEAYARLHAHFHAECFHCAHEVLSHVPAAVRAGHDLRAAIEAFVGGTGFAGMTCSALAAGVMLIGLELGEIEDSTPRVLRMLATMAVGGDALANDRNAFNRAMNVGHELATWFRSEFGSTQCRELTRCDFATLAGVQRYIENDCVTRCAAIARDVAAQVRGIVERESARSTGRAGAPRRA